MICIDYTPIYIQQKSGQYQLYYTHAIESSYYIGRTDFNNIDIYSQTCLQQPHKGLEKSDRYTGSRYRMFGCYIQA